MRGNGRPLLEDLAIGVVLCGVAGGFTYQAYRPAALVLLVVGGFVLSFLLGALAVRVGTMHVVAAVEAATERLEKALREGSAPPTEEAIAEP